MTIDYNIEDPEGNKTGVCIDCSTPALYDYADEQYHHAVNAARGCFLIPSEDRADDTAHPLYGRYTTWKTEDLVSVNRGDYLAEIQENVLGTLWRLHWTDGVTGDWSENFYSFSAALCRLAALEFCKDGSRFFLTDENEFNSQAHTFINSVLSDPC